MDVFHFLAKKIVGDLCKGQAGLIVHLEDLLYGVDVSRRPQIQAQVVLVCRAHDLLQETKMRRNEQTSYINSVASVTFMQRTRLFVLRDGNTILSA